MILNRKNFLKFSKSSISKSQNSLFILYKNILFSPITEDFCHHFSNIMESVLAITSANSLRTLGQIYSFPMDLCGLRSLRWSQIQPPLKGERLGLPSPCFEAQRGVGRVAVSKTSPAFSMLVST